MLRVLSCGFAMGWVAPAFGLPTLEEIRRVQARRVEKAGPLRFVWEGREVWVNGWDGRPDEPVPCRHGGEVIVSGSSIRFVEDREVWSDIIGGVGEPTRAIVVWGDKAKKWYIPKHDTVKGLSGPTLGCDSWGNLEVVSMTASFMTGARHLTPDCAMEVLREEETPEGRRIVVGNTETEYHLDPARDFVVVRLLGMFPDGRINREANVEYGPHPVLGYAPTRVTSVLMERRRQDVVGRSAGGLEEVVMRTNTLTVKQVETDVAVEPSMFDTAFPPGLGVKEYNSAARYITRPKEDAATGDGGLEETQSAKANEGDTSSTVSGSKPEGE